MFNMLSGLIAAEVAGFMGLSFGNIVDLIAPVLCSVGTWNLLLEGFLNKWHQVCC